MVRRAKFLPGFFAALVFFSSPAIAWAVPGKSPPAGTPRPAQVPPLAATIGLQPQVSPTQGVLPGSADAAPRNLAPSPLDYRTAQQAAFSLQGDIHQVAAELSAVHDLELAGMPSGLEPRKRALRDKLASLMISVAPDGFDPKQAKFAEVKIWLEHSRGERDRLLDEMRGHARAGRIEEMESVADKLLALNGDVLRLQLLSADRMLAGASGLRSKPLRRNAALSALNGAFRSAAAQNAELRYQLRRIPVRRASPLPGRNVRVSRWGWMSAHAALEDAARDLRNGRPERGLRRLEGLADIYGRDSSLEDYARFAGKLRALGDRIGAAMGEAAQFSGEVLALRGQISHPLIKVPRTFGFPDMETARRSYAHELESMGKQRSLLLRHMARLEYFQDILHAASNHAWGALAADERKKMAADLDALREWAEKGFVQEKQAAKDFLDGALSGLRAFARLPRGREHDLPRRRSLARILQNMAAARREFSQRLNELERISGRVRAALARLGGPI